MGAIVVGFEPSDTWFFRDSRSFDAGADNEAAPVFPPPCATLAGVVRSMIGDALDVDWRSFAQGDEGEVTARVSALIGRPGEAGQLRIAGPYVRLRGERWYPIPRVVSFWPAPGGFRARRVDAEPVVPLECDLGTVALPAFPQANPEAPADSSALYSGLAGRPVWVRHDGLEAVLAGGLPGTNSVLSIEDLFKAEPRTGLGRDNQRATADDENSLLYSVAHLRPTPLASSQEFSLELDVEGMDETLVGKLPRVTKAGGEGRMAWVNVQPRAAALPARPSMPKGKGCLAVTLMTHADFEGGWLPPGFAAADGGGWEGELAGQNLRLLWAVTEKAAQQGGWDQARRRPKPLRALVPSGSVYIAESANADAAADALHGAAIGRNTEFGYGRVVVGAVLGDET